MIKSRPNSAFNVVRLLSSKNEACFLPFFGKKNNFFVNLNRNLMANQYQNTNYAVQHDIKPNAYIYKSSLFASTKINNTRSDFDCEKTLEAIAKQLKGNDKPFENVMVVAVQHILGTTVDMFKELHRLGLEKAIIGGKSYSTHADCIDELKSLGYKFIDAPDQLGYGRYDGCMQETVSNLWRTALYEMQKSYNNGKKVDLLIILDDGGDLILSTPGKLFNGIKYKPNRVIGIEQTRGGSNHCCFKGVPFPIINVAGSYVKTAIEYPWVAEIVARKVIREVQAKAEIQLTTKPVIGVVGNGTMGQAITDKFIAEGYLVLVHDKANKTKHRKAIWQGDILSLISNADVIIGCTGTDITEDPRNLEAILNSIKPKYLVSTSSKDIEFNSLLIYIQEKKKQLEQTPNPLEDIVYTNPDNPACAKIVVLKGGFPINFDNKRHYVPPEKIWPIHAALMGACLMAVRAYQQNLITSADVLKLDTESQLLILKEYQRLNPMDPTISGIEALTDEQIKNLVLTESDGIELSFSPAPTHTPTYSKG